MVGSIDDMPAGTIGLKASGKLTREDYRDVIEPALSRGFASGELRMVFLLTDYQGLDSGAWVEDFKTGMRTWVREHAAWKRFALVTDVEWVAKAMRMFTWLTPGEVKVCELDELDEAKIWVGD